MPPDLWIPVPEGPHEALVERIGKAVASFAEEKGVTAPIVDLELADGARFSLDRIDSEPGFGMVTIHVHSEHDPESPEALVIPLGTIRRIELRSRPDEQSGRFGFTVPPA